MVIQTDGQLYIITDLKSRKSHSKLDLSDCVPKSDVEFLVCTLYSVHLYWYPHSIWMNFNFYVGLWLDCLRWNEKEIFCSIHMELLAFFSWMTMKTFSFVFYINFLPGNPVIINIHNALFHSVLVSLKWSFESTKLIIREV